MQSFLRARALVATVVAISLAAAAQHIDARENWYATADPDQSDWSPARKSGYVKSLSADLGDPAAVLEIAELDISVAVYDDTAKMSLERGAGWVEGTAFPGETGNIAIAGHRDGFFRPLENVILGMPVQLRRADGVQAFEVTAVSIVDALDVSVLDPTDDTVLTLITCHPFRFRGFAPDRYIVRARRIDPIARHPTGAAD